MGILHARILDWITIPSSRVSFQPRDQTRVSYVSCIGRWVLYHYCHLGSPSGILLSHKKGISASSNEKNESRAYLQSAVSQKEKMNIIY